MLHSVCHLYSGFGNSELCINKISRLKYNDRILMTISYPRPLSCCSSWCLLFLLILLIQRLWWKVVQKVLKFLTFLTELISSPSQCQCTQCCKAHRHTVSVLLMHAVISNVVTLCLVMNKWRAGVIQYTSTRVAALSEISVHSGCLCYLG